MDKEVEKENISMDTNIRITHNNNLWLLYRALSEDVNYSIDKIKMAKFNKQMYAKSIEKLVLK